MRNRKILIGMFAAFLLGVCAPAPAETNWRVNHSFGLDTLVFIGALSGDLLAEQHYQADVSKIRATFSKAGLEALNVLDQEIRVKDGGLVGPSLALYISAVPLASTLSDLLAVISDPDRIHTALAQTSYWDEKDWETFQGVLPHLRIVVEELQRVGFEQKWRQEILPQLEKRLPVFTDAVTPYDVIAEQERLLGRKLDPVIEIIVVHYSQPYGIKITGQRFLTHHSYQPELQLRTAAHEIFHPPFDLRDSELRSLVAPLAMDKWMQNIVKDHDPRYGYNSFRGIMNEDSAQALDQIVSERLGFARDPAQRFLKSDDGMHMVAAALYHAMKEDGFDERGGNYSDWLKSMLTRGQLTPEDVRRRAEMVVGAEAVNKWDYP